MGFKYFLCSWLLLSEQRNVKYWNSKIGNSFQFVVGECCWEGMRPTLGTQHSQLGRGHPETTKSEIMNAKHGESALKSGRFYLDFTRSVLWYIRKSENLKRSNIFVDVPHQQTDPHRNIYLICWCSDLLSTHEQGLMVNACGLFILLVIKYNKLSIFKSNHPCWPIPLQFVHNRTKWHHPRQ